MAKNTAIAQEIIEALQALGNPERAKHSSSYFKTGKGQYGEGDVFWGLRVPDTRKIAKRYFKGCSLEDVEHLLNHEVHEVRFVALEILVLMFEKADDVAQKQIYDFYLSHTQYINNWDLVDTSAPYILGEYSLKHPNELKTLQQLIVSTNLWERRMAIVSMFPKVREQHFETALNFAEALLTDKHDLIHKAVGWVLRDIGDNDISVLKKFLDKHADTMPRTTLRYALEHFEETTRKHYLALKGNVKK